MIDRETIDRIFDAVDVVDVVGDFVHLKKRGVNYLGNCPFHNEKTPSFTVSPAKGIYKCFGCGAGGNSVNFIMEHEHLSYVETLKFLAKKYNIEVQEKELSPEQKEQKDARESMLIVNEFAQKTFTDNLYNTDEGKAVGLKYFKERGFTDQIIKKFDLGYCRSQRDSFGKLAISKGYKQKYLVETGLCKARDDGSVFDFFSERVMFPVHNLMGRVVAFGGRTLRNDKKLAKYFNSPESELYHKSRNLYGIFLAKKSITKSDKCFLVEGYTDVMRLHQAGIENVVASSGTALTAEQIRLIRRFTPNITMLFDGDTAGIKAALRGVDLVLEEGMNVKVVLLPDGEDPDSFAQKQSATEFSDYIAANESDFISFKTKLLLPETANDPVKKAHLISDIVRTIAVIPDGIQRSVYIKECAGLMGVDEKVLYAEINKLLNKKRDQEWQRQKQQPTARIPSAAKQEVAAVNKFDVYEKEIVRLLLSYGHKILFTIAATDEAEEQQISAAQYICNELEDEIEIQSEIYQLIFTEYRKYFDDGITLPLNHFSKHENQRVTEVAADMLSQKHEVSKMWSKKGTYVNTEEDNLKLVIDAAINGYKYELIMGMLQQIEKELKAIQGTENAGEKTKELYDKYMAYTQFKIAISKKLGDRIVLKR